MSEKPTNSNRSKVTEMPLEPGVADKLSDSEVLEGSVHQFRGWPTRPNPVKHSISSILTDLSVDGFLLAISVAFLGFAITVHQYDQAPVAKYPHTTEALLSASKYAPTILPILFACVVGRAANAILIWRLEKGEHVGILDLLAGSTSLTSTVTSQLKLRMLSFLGLILIAIWALSPIGGQASIRQLTVGTKTSSHSASFTYMLPGTNMYQFGDSDFGTYTAIVNTLFVASLIAPAATKSSPRDTWANVKIPMIEPYEDVSAPNDGGWFHTSDDHNTYSSLIGVPMSGTDVPDYSYVMNLETQYFHLDCQMINGSSGCTNTSMVGDGACIRWSANLTHRATANIEDLEPFEFIYMSWGPTGLSKCTITTSYVEVEISCPTSSACAASKLRRSRLDHPPPGYTQLDRISYANWPIWELYGSDFVGSIKGHPAYPTTAQYYLLEPNNPVAGSNFLDNTGVQLPSNKIYSLRLGQLMNAYWTCISGMYAVAGGVNINTTHIGNSQTSATFMANATTAEGTKSIKIPVIESHTGWVIALCIASVVMIIASLVNPVVRIFLNHVPDLMLNISSLATRNNPYIPLPTQGSFMVASDRARHLKDLKVRYGDIEPDSSVGNLSIASLDSVKVPKVAGVRKGRLYQ